MLTKTSLFIALVAALAVTTAASAQTPATPLKPGTLTGADFSATPNPAFTGQRIRFDPLGSRVTCGGWGWGCTPDTYNWDFGDGTTAFGTIQDKSYARPGTYTVTLVVCNCERGGGFTSTARHTVTILARP